MDVMLAVVNCFDYVVKCHLCHTPGIVLSALDTCFALCVH